MNNQAGITGIPHVWVKIPKRGLFGNEYGNWRCKALLILQPDAHGITAIPGDSMGACE